MWILMVLTGCNEAAFVHPSPCESSARTRVPLKRQTSLGSANALAEGLGRLQLGVELTGSGPVPNTVQVDDVLSLSFAPERAFEVELVGGAVPYSTCPTGTGLEIAGTLTVRSAGGLLLAGDALVIATSDDPSKAWFTWTHLTGAGPTTGEYAEIAEDHPCPSGPREGLVGALTAWSPPGAYIHLVPETAIGGEGILEIMSGCVAGPNEQERLLVGTTFLLP